jgi:hypothetical protein
VGKLVQDGDDAAFANGIGDLGAEHVRFGESYGSSVFHGARVEFRHEQLVILVKRICVVKGLFEELEAFAGLVEDVVGIKKLGHRGSSEDAKRDYAAVAAGEFTANFAVRAGD